MVDQLFLHILILWFVGMLKSAVYEQIPISFKLVIKNGDHLIHFTGITTCKFKFLFL